MLAGATAAILELRKDNNPQRGPVEPSPTGNQDAANDPYRPIRPGDNTGEQRNNLDMPLAELVTTIKAAAARHDEYDGRTSEDTNLPDLIDDANDLRDFFIASGAVYQGDERRLNYLHQWGGPPDEPTDVVLTTA